MITLRICLVFLLILPTTKAVELEQISLFNFQKEILSSSHLRFYQKSGNHTIHLQAEKYDHENHWNLDNLDQEVKLMFKKRQAIYELLGFTQAKLDFFSYANKTLTIRGSYLKLNGTKVYFEEKNFYHREYFLQLKVLSPTKIHTHMIEQWIKEISPFSVELDHKTSREDND